MVTESVLSVADVNDRIPLVRSIVKDLLELHGDVASRRERLLGLRERYPAGGSSIYEDEVRQMEDELSADERRLEGYHDELRQLGGVLTDASAGFVDFPGHIERDSVWLCWQFGESEVACWHPGPCSVAGRIPLVAALETADGGHLD